MYERPRSVPSGARMSLILVPLVMAAAIYGMAVGLMNLPARAWGILVIAFCVVCYAAIWRGIRQARGVSANVDSSAPAARSSSVATQIARTLFRMSGGLAATGLSIWMIVQGDSRGWMLLPIALLFVVIRWFWLARSTDRP